MGRNMGRYVNCTKEVKLHHTAIRRPDTLFASAYEVRRNSRRNERYRAEIMKKCIDLVYFFLFCLCAVAIFSVYRFTKKC